MAIRTRAERLEPARAALALIISSEGAEQTREVKENTVRLLYAIRDIVSKEVADLRRELGGWNG